MPTVNPAPVQKPQRKRPKLTNLPDREYYLVPELADVTRMDQCKILGWIRRGELLAINMAENPGGRPRWRVPREAWQAFQLVRSNQATAPAPRPQRRRRRREGYVMRFYT